MGMLVDIKGIGPLSLKRSAWAGFGVIFFWTFSTMLITNILSGLNHQPLISIYIIHIFLEWHSVLAWTTWFICIAWGAIALSLPVRPRAPKRAALIFWLILIGLHMITHTVWITVFLMRSHKFFISSLFGNIAKSTIETFLDKTSKLSYVQDFLYVATPVVNWLSAPYIYHFLHSLPPLHLIFWAGWNWVLVGFAFGVLPVLSIAAVIPIIMGYISAIDLGGNGSECVAPSQLHLFYALDLEDRMTIRAGQKPMALFLEDADVKYNSGTGSSNSPGGSKSSSLRSWDEQDAKPSRIPSYKPNRKFGNKV